MQTAPDKSQPRSFCSSIQELRFNKYQARFTGDHRGISPCRPPACTSPLKYKIISTDISPNAAMRAPKSRFPGKWRGRKRRRRGRHVWRLRARTVLPSPPPDQKLNPAARNAGTGQPIAGKLIG